MSRAKSLAQAGKGAINFHDGPLPRYAGLNAPVWAIINGEPDHGITWHMIEGGVDEGDILEQRLFELASEETALTLNTGTWNANTFQFDVSQNGSRSISAKSFAFAIGNLNPKTSLIGITVKAEVAGTSQAGGKSVQWQ